MHLSKSIDQMLSILRISYHSIISISVNVILFFFSNKGIPLSLIMFQSVAERLNCFLRYFCKKVKSNTIFCFKFKSKSASNFDLILIECLLTIILVITSAHIFHVYEGWTYFDCFYYSFITFFTIGK